ncbi:MAG TPA: LysR family transcriptional regulator [Microbacterium sp.]|nr:LysR family transcriptional regulator [Microbacterium sp.]
MMLDLNRLAMLRELETRGSIVAVSRAIGISPSAISQQLAKLEAEVGMKLLEPVGRQVRLTQVGIDLAHRADEVIRLLEQTEAELEQRSTRVQGIVRFASFSTFALRYLPDVLRRMARSHPDVVVEFTQVDPTDALNAVTRRRADLAVTDEYPNIPRAVVTEMTRTFLSRDPIAVYAPVPVQHPTELAKIPWIFEPAETDAALWATRACREAGFEPIVRFTSANLRIHHSLVQAGEAAAFLPRMLLGTPDALLDIPEHRVVWGEAELYRDVYAVTRRGGTIRPAVAALLQHLKEVVADAAAETSTAE